MSVLKLLKNTFLFLLFFAISCGNRSNAINTDKEEAVQSRDSLRNPSIVVGANRTASYLPLLAGKRIGVVANQTSVIFKSHVSSSAVESAVTPSTAGNQKKFWPRASSEAVEKHTHLVDSLLSHNINLKKVFAPEHGFRGKADAGEHVKDGVDTKTGLPLLSLHGKNRKPTQEQLSDLDMVIFDIQDVGARFYTYISTMHYVMEACAEAGIPMLVLDRPNPNGHYIDGPILEEENRSFLGMHPVPIVHGMTIGEYAQMINGQGWLKDGRQCELKVIKMENYTHDTPYSLPIKPSPNLPNDVSINLYPSLCFFEQTNVSIGRGTDMQFQIAGIPHYRIKRHYFNFTPMPNEGSKYPKHEGKECWGYNLSGTERLSEIKLDWLIEFYQMNQEYGKEEPFFYKYLWRLAGTKKFQEQIEAGWSAEQIKATWQEGLDAYREMRKPYLLYP